MRSGAASSAHKRNNETENENEIEIENKKENENKNESADTSENAGERRHKRNGNGMTDRIYRRGASLFCRQNH